MGASRSTSVHATRIEWLCAAPNRSRGIGTGRMARLLYPSLRGSSSWREYGSRLCDLPSHVAVSTPSPPTPARLDGPTCRVGSTGALAMKILQLTRQFLPSEGGIESVVEGLGCALQRKGHTVCVATLRTLFATGETVSTESVEAGLTVKRMCHWGPRRYPIALAALAQIRGYDLVHIHAIDF